MKKRIMGSTLLIALGLSCYLYLSSKNFEDCRESVFQQSKLYGQAPRRFYEITDLPEHSNWSKLAYFITFYCNPNAILSVSRFSCKLQETRPILDPESPYLVKLVEHCRKSGQSSP